ncbi:TPA: DUF362 domain-containing protein [Candidatus Poribacteria bacterium]|nr:DUF362 domain-containing protein [Candidatus Poribacteria bacterium]
MRLQYDPTRRDFLRKTALATFGLNLFQADLFNLFKGMAKSKVVIAQNPSSISERLEVSSRAVESMLDEAMAALTGKDPKDAWKALFDKGDTVGIKVNTLAGKRLSTHPELAYAVAERLISAGVKPYRIIIWDRSDDELREAGFKVNRSGRDIRCLGTESDYEADLTMFRSIASCFSTILTRCTALINLPVLKHHEISGVTIALKNWFGAIHNPNKYHDNGCDPFIADLNAIGKLRDKKRLIICDGLLSQYEFGPGYKPHYAWRPGVILVSSDPVALDRVGMDMIERKRKEVGLKPLSSNPQWCRHIFTAADKQHNLGVADMKKIEIVRV